ncbi:MAG: glycosyltransferase [Planctomycetota bacterium]|nr:MAG: glycosyltransferase [Planctomycetota bacterium]
MPTGGEGRTIGASRAGVSNEHGIEDRAPAPAARERFEQFASLLLRHGPGHALLRTAWRAWRPWRARWLRARRTARPIGPGANRAGALPTPTPSRESARTRVIVPTRGRSDYVRRCVRSIERTCRPDTTHLVVVDTGARSPAHRRRLEELTRRHSLVRWRRPFHFARLNNWAARGGDEPLLLFLNDDTEALEPGWLERMAQTALRPDVGVVGAVLLYPDRTLQHAGIALGHDPPTYHRWLGVDEARWQQSLPSSEPFDVAAVTGAALMCRREVFEAVGGFCPRFSLFYNDVDLCLRVRLRLGLRCVVDPRVRLVHHESRSRGRYHRPEEESLFVQRWGGRLRWVEPEGGPR